MGGCSSVPQNDAPEIRTVKTWRERGSRERRQRVLYKDKFRALPFALADLTVDIVFRTAIKVVRGSIKASRSHEGCW